MAEEEEGDMTVIDVLNTNQRLCQNKGLKTESSAMTREAWARMKSPRKSISATQAAIDQLKKGA